MKKLLFVASVALALTGCASLGETPAEMTGSYGFLGLQLDGTTPEGLKEKFAGCAIEDVNENEVTIDGKCFGFVGEEKTNLKFYTNEKGQKVLGYVELFSSASSNTATAALDAILGLNKQTVPNGMNDTLWILGDDVARAVYIRRAQGLIISTKAYELNKAQ